MKKHLKNSMEIMGKVWWNWKKFEEKKFNKINMAQFWENFVKIVTNFEETLRKFCGLSCKFLEIDENLEKML